MSQEGQEMPDSPFQPIEEGETDDMGGTDSMADTGSSSPLDRLFDGSAPGPSVGELRADYSMPQWLAVMSRGIMRVATGDGVPPIAEIIIGGVMGAMGRDFPGLSLSRDDGESTDSGSTPDVGSGAPPGMEL
jgi:hypothetical protein